MLKLRSEVPSIKSLVILRTPSLITLEDVRNSSEFNQRGKTTRSYLLVKERTSRRDWPYSVVGPGGASDGRLLLPRQLLDGACRSQAGRWEGRWTWGEGAMVKWTLWGWVGTLTHLLPPPSLKLWRCWWHLPFIMEVNTHSPGPGGREAEGHLAGASVAAVWLLDKINQQGSSNVDELCRARPWPSEHKHV